jgi:hypothetical protein
LALAAAARATASSRATESFLTDMAADDGTAACAVRIPHGVDRESDHRYFGIMKTTVEIPDEELRDLVRFTRAKTKRAAIVTAIEDFNRRRRMAALVKHSGTFHSLAANDAIEALESREPHGRVPK